MIAYQKEKIDNAICFFAVEFKKRTHKPLSQAILYKLLAFLDFYSVRDTGIPALGLNYCAMEEGPVPVELYENNTEADLYKFSQDEDKKNIIITKGTPNMDYFSGYEIDEMNKLMEIYADGSINADYFRKASNDDIPAWNKACKIKPGSPIDYKDMFNDCFEKKGSENLSSSEKRYIIQKCLTDFHE